MEYLLVGKIINTHGIKGELRISSSFEYKKRIFSKGCVIYIDNKPFNIQRYRVHKKYDMVTFEGITNINEVLEYRNKEVFVKVEDLKLEKGEYLKTDLIGMNVICMSTDIGIVDEIITNNKYYIMKLSTGNLIPVLDEFILDIDFEENKINIKYMEGLINED